MSCHDVLFYTMNGTDNLPSLFAFVVGALHKYMYLLEVLLPYLPSSLSLFHINEMGDIIVDEYNTIALLQIYTYYVPARGVLTVITLFLYVSLKWAIL